MAKLINVIKDGEGELDKRQLPLVIDEKLTMVLDLLNVDFMCEYPKFRGKDKELFLRKYSMLNAAELKQAFQVSCKRLLDIVSEIVPCVGCRRSVERLFRQMKDGPGRAALYPLIVTSDGVLILPDEVYKWPNVIGAMFHNHIAKLNSLSTSWNRSKKSSRCTLHSLDAQRYVRPPLGSGWKALWECMVPFCKQEVATIDTAQLLSTLETYLQKHRFCTECRTKVMKAYSLLVDEPEDRKGDGTSSEMNVCNSPCEHNHTDENCSSGANVKEKGFIPSLYAGIRRCSPNNHIHVDQRTDYIMGLILAAEPELLGNRRERHAKTLEIAQEEVLVCVGLCLYERVHRIQLRLREEQTTCQLLALVAINALSTNFQLAVEMKQGISQLELLFEEFSREDRLKQRRKQVRKLKKRRKKERKNATSTADSPSDNAADRQKQDYCSDDAKDEEDSEEDDEDEIIRCLIEKKKHFADDSGCAIKPLRTHNDRISKTCDGISEMIGSKYLEKNKDSCFCSKYDKSPPKSKEGVRNKFSIVDTSNTRSSRLLDAEGKKLTSIVSELFMTQSINHDKPDELKSSPVIPVNCRASNEFSDSCSTSSSSSVYSKCNDKDNMSHSCKPNSNNTMSVASNDTNAMSSNSEMMVSLSCDDCAHNDCGYGSADNNVISSSNTSGDSSVDSSEVACSEGFCNHDGSEDCNFDTRNNGGGEARGSVKRASPNPDQIKNSIAVLNVASPSLLQMLTETTTTENESNDDECTIPIEVIERYKSNAETVKEKRKLLHETLETKFAQWCSSMQQSVVHTPT